MYIADDSKLSDCIVVTVQCTNTTISSFLFHTHRSTSTWFPRPSHASHTVFNLQAIITQRIASARSNGMGELAQLCCGPQQFRAVHFDPYRVMCLRLIIA